MSRYPFKFLNPYDSSDTDIFFGREEEVDQLYQMAFQTDIILVYGGSGTGKTSLINCGLASRFQSYDWLALNIRRGQDVNAALRETLKAAVGTQIPADVDLDWLDEEEETDAMTSELARDLKAIYRQYFRPIYLIFDQFEELYILGNKEEQTSLVETVKDILQVEQPVKMIFIIREEYLGHLFEFERAVPQLLRKKLRVEPMNLDKVRQVIRGATTLKDSNVGITGGEEADIVEEIFARIKGEEKTLAIQLPYLQVFLDKLYLHITDDDSREAVATFSMAALAEMGDIGDVLRNFLEEQAQRIQNLLSARYPELPGDAIWRILSPFVTLDGTKEPLAMETLRQRMIDYPDEALGDALQQLENSRIIRYEENQGLYEIAHDSLAKRIAERRSDDEIALLEIRRLIKSQTSLQADARELFSEKQLNFIYPFLDKLALNEEEQELIRASRAAVIEKQEAAKRQAEAETQRLLERQRLLEKNQKNQRRFIAVMGAFLVGMIALAIWAVGQQGRAIENAKTAQENAQIAEERLRENEKNQSMAKARELEAFGDSYLDLGKANYACNSYREALAMMEAYEEEDLFHQISNKQEAACK